MRYRPEIDGLRALAVVPVLLFHAGFSSLAGGYVGVDVFFVISGYLITTLTLTQLEEGRFSFASFYLRRAQRLAPALSVVALTTSLFAWLWLPPRALRTFAQSLVAMSVFGANVLFLRQSDYFDQRSELKPLLHTWSLSVEEQYYLLAPLLLALLWRRPRWLLSVSVALCAVSLALAQLLVAPHPNFAFYMLPTRAWELLVGVLCALTLKQRPAQRPPQPYEGLLGWVGLALIIGSTLTFNANTPTPSLATLPPVLGAALIICYAPQGSLIARLLSLKPLVITGLLSYSLYLWHQPILALWRVRLGHSHPLEGLWRLAPLLLSAALAYLTWRWVEGTTRRAQLTSKGLMALLGLPFALLVSFGLMMHMSDGHSARFKRRYGEQAEVVARQLAEGPYYVISRWSERVLKPFSPHSEGVKAPKERLLLIGDSFAQDLLNAIAEAGFLERYEVSVHHISARCGNLWTGRSLSAEIDPRDQHRCARTSRYKHPKLQGLLQEADEVWLASSWRGWQLPYLPETFQALATATPSARLKLFGRKSFGEVSMYDWLERSDQGQRPYINALELDHLETSRALRALAQERLRGVEFIDLSALFCGALEALGQCVNSDAQGRLLSYDGKHLTRAGAQRLGELLRARLSP